MKEMESKIEQLKNRFTLISEKINKDKLNQELLEIEAKTMKSDFWGDIVSAQTTMQQIADIRSELAELNSIDSSLANFSELLTLDQESLENLDLENEFNLITSKVNELEKKRFLSGKFDSGGCLLSLHSGQGGVEAMDWAQMLVRMYSRFCEKKGWDVTLIDETKGEEAGIKEATLEIKGRFAYGLLKKESGTHRLVRLSPFNADNLRQTSFALVEVLPIIGNPKELEIKETDLEFDMFRSSGPGGQNVQKVSTAVRVKHIPSGITVTCQSERSQYQNKENCLKILTAKLFQKQEEERKKNEQNLKGWDKTASFGTQIRSYVLHPYKMVKDNRTSFETTAAEAVLDGELEGFIDAELRL